MEDKICPLRMIGKNRDKVLYTTDNTVIPGFECVGEKCAWFIKNEYRTYDLAECAVMSLVSIQDLVR